MGLRATGRGLLCVAALTAGCTSRGRVDLLESRLRQQEDSLNQLQSQLSHAESELQAARRESQLLKTRTAEGAKGAPIEQVGALGKAEGIVFNKLLTGGLDRDGAPGDEILSAVIVPNDADGNLVKVPGAVQLTVLDLALPAGKQQLGRWDFSQEESSALWTSGFLGSGYVVKVPWQVVPRSPSLLVHARLTTPDGRQFDTSQSIRITPPASAAAPPPNLAAANTPKAPANRPQLTGDPAWWKNEPDRKPNEARSSNSE